MSTDLAAEPLRSPGKSAGLLGAFRWRFLLRLLIKKELRVRYRGSVLGMAWSYVKPAFQLLVFWVAMDRFLGLGRAIPNYVVYLFAGIVMTNFFSEVLRNTTRSIIDNSSLVNKIYLPRELFPVSSLWVAFVHLVPQLVVLFVASLAMGWRPTVVSVLGIVASIVVVGCFALGVGLAFAAFDVFFRDAENLIELINMVAVWLTPTLYAWQFVHDALPGWAYLLYESNPLNVGVELAHLGFWSTTRGVFAPAPAEFKLAMLVGIALSALVLLVGQWIFRSLEGKFAQEL